MKKWQEIYFNALSNISVAMIGGGVLQLIFGKNQVVSSVVVLIVGIYFLSITIFTAKQEEEASWN